MLHQVGVSFDLYCDARKHKINTSRISPTAALPLSTKGCFHMVKEQGRDLAQRQLYSFYLFHTAVLSSDNAFRIATSPVNNSLTQTWQES